MEIPVFLALVFAVAVLFIWLSRRRDADADQSGPAAGGDRPEPALSSESGIAPHRNLGRPIRVDRGDGPPAGPAATGDD